MYIYIYIYVYTYVPTIRFSRYLGLSNLESKRVVCNETLAQRAEVSKSAVYILPRLMAKTSGEDVHQYLTVNGYGSWNIMLIYHAS